MNARTICAEVAELSHLAIELALAGRKAGLHREAIFSRHAEPARASRISYPVSRISTPETTDNEHASCYPPRYELR